MLHAVVIGINEYADERISPLNFARADAIAVHDALSRIEEGQRSLRLLVDEEATRSNIQVAIAEDLPDQVGADDTVLIYFAGHGSPETKASPDDRNRFLVCHDAKYEHLFTTGINAETDLEAWFSRLGAKIVVIVIDACFSGAAGGRTFEGPRLTAAYDKAGPRGHISVSDLDLGEGRVVLAACKDDQVALERAGLGHGIFTYHFLQSLEKPRPGGVVSIGALYEEVASGVRATTERRQTATFNGRHELLALPTLHRPSPAR